MTNIDRKVMLIMRLNAKLKRLKLYLLNNANAPKVIRTNFNENCSRVDIMENVLNNLGYLNY